MKPPLWIAAALFLIATLSNSHARWATEKEAQYVIEKRTADYTIRKDGTHRIESSDVYRIQTDQARNALGTLQLQYNEAAESFEILEAATLNDGQRLDVPRSQIVDKPVSNNRQGFDQMRQYTIAFPEVRVGSKLIIKTSRDVRFVTVPNQFAQDEIHGRSREENTTIRFRSELPLYWKSSSAENELSFECKKKGPTTESCLDLVIRTLHPIHREAIDETQPFASWDQFPGWVVTSSLNWTDYYQPLAREWAEKIKGDLPKALKDLILDTRVTQGKRGGTPSDQAIPDRLSQLNHIMAHLAEKFRYMGDWRPVRGGWVPRGLDEIVEGRSGDCKDLTMVTIALLREAGIDASPALTMRGEHMLSLPWANIPHQSFNHAIVAVTDPVVVKQAGHIVFLDATNPMTFAQGTPSDIAGRQVVLLHPDRPIETLESPLGSPLENRVNIDLDLAPIAGQREALEATGSLERTGDLAYFLAGAELSNSSETIGRQIVLSVQDEKLLGDWSIAPFDLKSRIVRDLEFKFKFKTLRAPIRTSAGYGYTPTLPSALTDLMVPLRNRVTGIWLSLPYRRHLRAQFKKVQKQGTIPLDCNIKSPWASFERKLTAQAHGFRIDDDYTLLTRWISAEDLKSQSFKTFQNRLASCIDHVVVIYR